VGGKIYYSLLLNSLHSVIFHAKFLNKRLTQTLSDKAKYHIPCPILGIGGATRRGLLCSLTPCVLGGDGGGRGGLYRERGKRGASPSGPIDLQPPSFFSMDDALSLLSRALDSQDDCTPCIAREFPSLGSTRELLLTLTEWLISCPSSNLSRVSVISTDALWSLLVKETSTASSGKEVNLRPVRESAVSPVFDALRTTLFKDTVCLAPNTFPLLSVCYHGWSKYFTLHCNNFLPTESCLRSSGALLAAEMSRAALLFSTTDSATQGEYHSSFLLLSEQAISLVLQSCDVDIPSLFFAASELPSPPPLDLPWPLRILSPPNVASLVLLAHAAFVQPSRKMVSRFPIPHPHLDGFPVSLETAHLQLFPPSAFQCLPSLLPTIIPRAFHFKWILWLTAPIAEELSLIWNSLEYSSINGSEENAGSAEHMMDGMSQKQTRPSQVNQTNLMILQRLGVPWLIFISDAVSFYQGYPFLPMLPLQIPGWHPCDDQAFPPPENVGVVVLGGLMTAVARAHSEVLSLSSRASFVGLLSLFSPSSAIKLLCTTLPKCPFKHVSSFVLGWVQKCAVSTVLSDERLFFTSLHCLIQSLAEERFKQGLLLALEEGGGKADSWQGLCNSLCTASESSKEEALALRVSSHLHSLSDSDLPLLSLIRTVLLRGKSVWGKSGCSRSARTLFPPSHIKKLLFSYALPLMSGLVPAQKAAREIVGKQAPYLHPLQPLSAHSILAARPYCAPVSSTEVIQSQHLSSLFLLESTLSPTIEVMEWWVANVKE
jgi:hypothetical protein